MSYTVTCCIPNCTMNTRFKHVSFYRVRPEWISLISEYILKQGRLHAELVTQYKKANSNLICGRHFRLCCIRERPTASEVYFPHLGITVSQRLRRVKLRAIGKSIFFSDDLAIGREETTPPQLIVREDIVDLSREKKVLKPKLTQEHCDHNYALTLNRIKFLRDDYQRVCQEKDGVLSRMDSFVKQYKNEIQHLNEVTHQLVRRQVYGGFEYPFRNIPDNEQMLKLYTGFSTRECFMNFLVIIKVKYDKARAIESDELFIKKQPLGMIDQLILVLARLRAGLLFQDLSYRFNIAASAVTKIWSFWTSLLSDVLAEESKKFNSEVTNSANNKIIIESNETLFEMELKSEKKIYGRAKALLELTPKGYVVNVSDVFAPNISNKVILEKCPSVKQVHDQQEFVNETKKESVRIATLQSHIQNILCFLKECKMLKGSFPNSSCTQKQLDTFWRICCFLVNFINLRSQILSL